MQQGDGGNLFTCTFCFNLFSERPRVCGEVVFRADECVSFGWCFWHKACYGCLLCGSRMICNGVPTRALYGDRHRPGQVQEVLQPPLCAVCMVEAELDELSDEAIVQKGLRRVDALDGGVTKRRWQAKDGQFPQHLDRDRSRDSLRHTGLDGTWSEGQGDNTRDIPQDSNIWVSIFDPVNGPSFKPSPLKPVPLFMRPASIKPGPARPRRAPSHAPSVHLQPPTKLAPSHLRRTRSPSPRSPTPTMGRPSRRQSSVSSETSVYHRDIGPLDWKSSISYIKEEPLKRPSSVLLHRQQKSEALSSAYGTPPEYVDEPRPLHCGRPLSPTLPANPLPLRTTSPMLREKARTEPPQSSEYLDSYRPWTAAERQQRRKHVPKPSRTAEVTSLVESKLELGTATLDYGNEEGKVCDGREGGRIRGVGAELRRFFMGR